MNNKTRAVIICNFLRNRYKSHLLDLKNWHNSKFELLIATILSQRTRDENTEKASKKLFSIARTPSRILGLSDNHLQKIIKSSGFYRQKSNNIKKVSKILIEQYKGKVPDTREELLSLPGVGYKTADVVLCYGFGRQIIPVDVHVAVCSKRIGLTNNTEPEKIRIDLERTFPEKCKRVINLGFVNFGKEICLTRSPKCRICELKNICQYYKNAVSRKK